MYYKYNILFAECRRTHFVTVGKGVLFFKVPETVFFRRYAFFRADAKFCVTLSARVNCSETREHTGHRWRRATTKEILDNILAKSEGQNIPNFVLSRTKFVLSRPILFPDLTFFQHAPSCVLASNSELARKNR